MRLSMAWDPTGRAHILNTLTQTPHKRDAAYRRYAALSSMPRIMPGSGCAAGWVFLLPACAYYVEENPW